MVTQASSTHYRQPVYPGCTRIPLASELKILRELDKIISPHYNRRNETQMWKSLTNNGEKTIHPVVGEGTFGAVISVKNPNNTYHVIKIAKEPQFNNNISLESTYLQRLQRLDTNFFIKHVSMRTVTLHTNLKCTNCCKERAILITEYGGKTVHREYVKKNPHLTLQQFMGMASRFVSIYKTLHDNNTELSDVKPANMVADSNHLIKIIDTADVHTFKDKKSDWYETTRPYRSPSVLQEEVDGGQTGFALACSLAEILIGTSLFKYVPIKGGTPESRMMTQLVQVFSFLHAPSSAFMNKINITWRGAIFGEGPYDKQVMTNLIQTVYNTTSNGLTPEIDIRRRIQQAIDPKDPRVAIGNIDPQEFTDRFVDFLKKFMEYEPSPNPTDLQNHPFLGYLQTSEH